MATILTQRTVATTTSAQTIQLRNSNVPLMEWSLVERLVFFQAQLVRNVIKVSDF